MVSFIKGAVIGMVAGATVGLMVSPKTKRKIMRTPNRVLRNVGSAIEHVMPY
ncbi:MAG: YtxH domain-containing protein [Oscillospiraceae bacterium]|jgi:gas vesicle protein|nr:YtxH domain-containing protein [Oscillospiraceae bacterium]